MRNFRLDDESGHQEALFNWAAYRTGLMPELQYMYHVPNGGKRDAATAVALKRQGVKAGVPDIMLPAARAGYHGLYIELKAGKNTTTKKQKEWLEYQRQQSGYYQHCCNGNALDYLHFSPPYLLFLLRCILNTHSRNTLGCVRPCLRCSCPRNSPLLLLALS